jgi:hypothetical protein
LVPIRGGLGIQGGTAPSALHWIVVNHFVGMVGLAQRLAFVPFLRPWFLSRGDAQTGGATLLL